MSWRAQNRSKDAKTPSVGPAMSDKPEPDRCPVQPYPKAVKGGRTQYRWIPHNAGFGFLDRPPAALGVFASLDRF